MSATAEGERPLQDKSSRPRLNQHDGLINSTAQITRSLQRWHSSVLRRHIINQGEIRWERKALRCSHVPRWYSLLPQRPQTSAGVEYVLQTPPRAKAPVLAGRSAPTDGGSSVAGSSVAEMLQLICPEENQPPKSPQHQTPALESCA